MVHFSYNTVSIVARDGWYNDFKWWSDYTIVAEGGKAGQGPVSAESPFVQEYKGKYFF